MSVSDMFDFPGLHSVELFVIAVDASVSNGAQGAMLYQNGRHQYEVTLTVEGVQENGHDPYDFSIFDDNFLYDKFYLCDFFTGQKFAYHDPAQDTCYANVDGTLTGFWNTPTHDALPYGLFYSNKLSQYCQTSTPGDLCIKDKRRLILKFFVSIKGNHQPLNQFKVSCGFSFNGTTIDTSRNGTGEKMPDNSRFTTSCSVSITPLPVIDYSLPFNINVVGGADSATDFELVSDKVHRYHESDIYLGHNDYDGRSTRYQVVLSPRNIKDGVTFFQIVKTKFDSDAPALDYNFRGRRVNIHGGGADMIYLHPDDSGYNTSLVFIQREKFGIESGNILFQDAWGIKDKLSYEIPADGKGVKHYWDHPLPSGSVRIDFCNHWVKSAASETRRDWTDENAGDHNGVKLHVIDNYGNTGTWLIQAVPGNWPKLFLNNMRLGKDSIS